MTQFDENYQSYEIMKRLTNHDIRWQYVGNPNNWDPIGAINDQVFIHQLRATPFIRISIRVKAYSTFELSDTVIQDAIYRRVNNDGIILGGIVEKNHIVEWIKQFRFRQ